MRTIRYTAKCKRESRGRHAKVIDGALREILEFLVLDGPLPEKNRDHPRTGNSIDHRDCHIRPDLILIYRKLGSEELELVRMGSHSELGF